MCSVKAQGDHLAMMLDAADVLFRLRPSILACRLLHLSSDELGDLGVRNVVYLVRARVENAQQIAEQIKATHK